MAPHFSILAAVLALSGCFLPTSVYGTSDMTVASLLTSSGGQARLVGLTASGGEVAVPLPGDRSTFLMFNSQNGGSERLAVDIQPTAAYKVASAAAQAPFEPRLRGLEQALRETPLVPGYRLQQATPVRPGTRERFWVIETIQGNQATETEVEARAVYVGQHCYVYLDAQVPDGRLDERIAQIGQTFDEKIFPTNSRLFGSPLASGVNGDPKVTLLISPSVGNYGQDTTIGYFTVRDLFTPGSDPDNPLLRHSNQRLMLYIAGNVVTRGQPADYLGTIAHEFQHLINASQKLFRPQGRAKTEEVWLDEALSMFAMEANGYGLTGDGAVVVNHVQAFQRLAPQYSLTDWRLNPDESAYGAAHLFSFYLVDRFGERILKDLVGSAQIGLANLGTQLNARNTSFEQVFNDWTAANLLDDTGLTDDPRYQYKGLSMLGTYGGKKLRGMSLEPVTLPNTGALSFKPYSAHYYYVPRGHGGSFKFNLTSRGAQSFNGLVVAP